MTTRTCYWLLSVFVGFLVCWCVLTMAGPYHGPGACGNSDMWLFFPGFVSMIVLGEVVGIVKACSRRRVPAKKPCPFEDIAG